MNDDLKSVVSRLIQDAQSQNRDTDHRMDMLDIYNGEPYGDEVEGKSSFVSTDAADAVDAILPDVLDPFTSTDRIVEFAPVGPEDEDAADQETDACHHIFWRLNNGFLILHTWFKEALIQQNAYLRSGWEETTRVEIENYEDLTPEEFGQLIMGKEEEYEFLELEGVDDQFQPEVLNATDTGEMQFAPINVSLRCTKTDKRYVIECLPQEEFFVTPRWTKLTFDGCPCHGARREMERGELLAMGFDEDSVAEATREYYSEEEVERRHETRDLDEYEPVEGDTATQKVSVYEAYVRADFNEDGRAELLKVWASGDGSTILRKDGQDAIEEVSHSPFSTLTPYPMPHRHVGRSVVEQVDDLQKVKTVLMRTTLDNIYATQYPRPVVDPNFETEDTQEDLENPDHGAPIRYAGPAGLQVYAPQPVAGVTLPLMDKFDDLKETRIGATRYNQGLDADSLNKTATGIKEIMNASQKKMRLIARVFAETGLRDVFLRMHRDLRNGGKDMILKLRNEWVPINPRAWKERTDMNVNVGIGNGDREEKRQAYMMMQQAMQQMMMDPELRKTGAIGYQQMYNLATRMAETFGIQSVAEFMTPPDQLQPPPEEGPNPQEQAMQAQMQMAQMDMQMRQQKQMADIQAQQEKAALDARKLELEAQIKMAELELKKEEARTRSAKAAADIQTDDERLELDRRKSLMEDDFKRDKLEADSLTGFMRDAQAFVNSQPPMEADYER